MAKRKQVSPEAQKLIRGTMPPALGVRRVGAAVISKAASRGLSGLRAAEVSRFASGLKKTASLRAGSSSKTANRAMGRAADKARRRIKRK